MGWGEESHERQGHEAGESNRSRRVTLGLSDLAAHSSSLPQAGRECWGALLNLSETDFPTSKEDNSHPALGSTVSGGLGDPGSWAR